MANQPTANPASAPMRRYRAYLMVPAVVELEAPDADAAVDVLQALLGDMPAKIGPAELDWVAGSDPEVVPAVP